MNIVEIVMSHAKNYDLIIAPHFITRLEQRRSDIVPDEKGLYILMSTKKPVHVEEQSDDRFKLFYSIDAKYDLIINLSFRNSNPNKIVLITIYPQEAKRRANRNE